MTRAATSFLMVIGSTIKFYRNTNVIDTPENIIASIAKLEKTVALQES